MKIVILSSESAVKKKWTIRVPNALLCSSSLAKFVKWQDCDLDFSQIDPKLLKQVLKKMKKDHPGTPLVQVLDPDGEGVEIWP